MCVTIRDPSGTQNVIISWDVAGGPLVAIPTHASIDVRPTSNHRRNKIPRQRYRYTYASRR